MRAIASQVRRFVLRLLGYRPVTIPGYHCGCCGSWNNEPRDVFRKHGRYDEWDAVGLCARCTGPHNAVNQALTRERQ